MNSNTIHGKRKPEYDLENAGVKRQAHDGAPAYLTSHHVGLTTDLEPLILHYLPLDANNECSVLNSCLRRVVPAEPNTGGIPGPMFVNVLDVHSNYLMMQRSHTVSLDALENLVAPYGPALVDTFFAKDVSSERGRAVREEITPALLAAIYLLSLPYLDVTFSSASSPAHGYGHHDSGRPNAARLKALTSRLLTESMSIPQSRAILATLQAGVLAAQCPDLNTSSLISQLISLVYDLGLHSDCGRWKDIGIGRVQRGLRRRLAWGVYVLDKWGAIVHGRPSLIREDEWDVPDLCAADFSGAYIHSQRVQGTNDNDKENEPEESFDRQEMPEEEIQHDHSAQSLLFTRTVSLTRIISSILTTFYTAAAIKEIVRLAPPTSPPSMRTRVVLEMAKPIQLRLKEWYAGLPSCLRMESPLESPDVTFSNPNGSGDGTDRGMPPGVYASALNGPEDDGIDRSLNGTLHLAYFAAEITLHRVIIRSLAVYAETDIKSSKPFASNDSEAAQDRRDSVGSMPMRNGSGIDTTPAPVPMPAADPDQYLIYICRSAAKTRLISALDFTNRLRPRHLTSPWPFYARSCLSLIGSFGLLLRITAATKSEDAFYGRRVGEYIWTLGVSETWGGSWVSWAGERVRELVEAASRSALPEKPEFIETTFSQKPGGFPKAGDQGYTSGSAGGTTPHYNVYRPFSGFNADPGDGPYMSDNEGDMMDEMEQEGSTGIEFEENDDETDAADGPINDQGDSSNSRRKMTPSSLNKATPKVVIPASESISSRPTTRGTMKSSKSMLVSPISPSMESREHTDPKVSIKYMARLKC
ncbi:Transcription factor [Ascosphaera apis ARSEF 7405]|uniref:Transcription factor n=1 Tax=Ascosphaera apis ARSEF 7405 TaxID=392613 RepID=A0A168BRS1_9EURO|nr:Transcription factor [Ascosphaera apis ARSEF 7405]